MNGRIRVAGGDSAIQYSPHSHSFMGHFGGPLGVSHVNVPHDIEDECNIRQESFENANHYPVTEVGNW